MSTVIAFRPTRRELARRAGSGLEVALFWNCVEDTVSVEVFDDRTEELFAFGVPRDRALDAFQHPFAYFGPRPAETDPEAELYEAA